MLSGKIRTSLKTCTNGSAPTTLPCLLTEKHFSTLESGHHNGHHGEDYGSSACTSARFLPQCVVRCAMLMRCGFQICSTRSGVLQNYHDECIRLNQTIQLLNDKIANTINEVFAEFEEPPALDALYGQAQLSRPMSYAHPVAELRPTHVNNRPSCQPLVAGHLPPFIMRLKLYAFNPPETSLSLEKQNRQSNFPSLPGHPVIGPSAAASTAHLFSPLSLEDCLPRQACIKSVPPGLALMSSEAEIERYEAQLWAGGASGRAPEGGWGSFRVFEQWLVDSMKWQWRDAFMYAKLRERQGSLKQMIAAKKTDIDDAVRLRLKQLWWGRLLEMQAYHSNRAEWLFTQELRKDVDCRDRHAGRTAAQESGKRRPTVGETASYGPLTTSIETERALMRAEDMRAYVLRVVENPAYAAFTESIKGLASRPSEASARVKFLKGQVERASGLIRRYDDATEDSDGQEILEQECNQLEAALALLQEEVKSLEKKRSFRQSQLVSKRQGLTQALQKLAEAFDLDNKKLAAIETHWDSAVKVEELVQALLPTADDIRNLKDRLAQDRTKLAAEQEQLEAQRQQLVQERQDVEVKKQLNGVVSPRERETGTARAGLPKSPLDDHPGSAPVPASPRTLHQDSDPSGKRLSATHSKSFIRRLFRGSSHVPNPRQSNAGQQGALSDIEDSDTHALVRRQSVASEPGIPGIDDPMPLRHGNSAPVQQVESLTSGAEHVMSLDASTLTLARVDSTRLDVPPFAHALSSPSVLNYRRQGEQSPRTQSPAVSTASAPGEHERDKGSPRLRRTEPNDDDLPKRKKSKNTVIASTRKNQRKKKSVYSKLRSALSLSQLPHAGKKREEQAFVAANEEDADNPGDVSEQHISSDANFAVSKPEGKEDSWADAGRQSSVLAALPNIFDSAEQEDGEVDEGTGPNDIASAAGSRDGDLLSRSRATNAAVEGQMSPDTGSAAAVGFSRSTTITFMDAGLSRVTPQRSLAESSRQSYSVREETNEVADNRPRLLASSSSSEKSFSPDRPDHGHVPHFGITELKPELSTGSTPREQSISTAARPAAEAEEIEPATTAPIMSFPSESAGSPIDFRWSAIGKSGPLVHPQANQVPVTPRRRRSDISGSATTTENASWSNGTRSSRALAFDRGAAGHPNTSSSRYVDEDDRIELFLANGQADLTTAVMNSCIFSLLDAEERQHCIHLMQNSFVQIPKGCMLIQRGDKVDTLYFLVSGALGMTEPNAAEPNTATQGLAPPRSTGRRRSSYDVEVPQERYPIELAPGSFVAPRAFVREEQTGHSVMALRPCTLQKLSYHSFQQVISGASAGRECSSGTTGTWVQTALAQPARLCLPNMLPKGCYCGQVGLCVCRECSVHFPEGAPGYELSWFLSHPRVLNKARIRKGKCTTALVAVDLVCAEDSLTLLIVSWPITVHADGREYKSRL